MCSEINSLYTPSDAEEEDESAADDILAIHPSHPTPRVTGQSVSGMVSQSLSSLNTTNEEQEKDIKPNGTGSALLMVYGSHKLVLE